MLRFVVGCVLLAAFRIALADSNPPDQFSDARRHFNLGVRYYQQRDYAALVCHLPAPH